MFKYITRCWRSPVAVIGFMALFALIAIGYELYVGIVSFVLMAQALHTIGDVFIFGIFERGISSGEEKGEGIWGILLGFLSFAMILAIMRFTEQGVDTTLLLPVLSALMMVMKIQFFLLARGRNTSHSATVAAGAHVLGDLVINIMAFAGLVLIGVLREFDYDESVVNLVDLWSTLIGIGVAILAGAIGIFVILRKNRST